jgi:hypothetical protein
MAEDAAEMPAEGEGQPAGEKEQAGPTPNMLHVTIESARGMPEESATVVNFKYSMLTEEGAEAAVAAAAEKGEDEKPLGVVEGKTTEFEEPPAGTEHTYGLKESYILPPMTGTASVLCPLFRRLLVLVCLLRCCCLRWFALVRAGCCFVVEAVSDVDRHAYTGIGGTCRSAAVSVHHSADGVQGGRAFSARQGAGGIARVGLEA